MVVEILERAVGIGDVEARPFGIVGRQFRQLLGTTHHAFERGVVEFAGGGGAGLFADGHRDGERAVLHFTRGGDGVARKADVAGAALDLHGVKVFRRQRRHGDRHVLNRLFTLLGRNNDVADGGCFL